MDTKFSFTLITPSGIPTIYSGRLPELSDAATDDLLREIRGALNKAAGKEMVLKRRETPPGMTRIEK